MADQPTSDSNTTTQPSDTAPRARRPVYEPTLLPERRRQRAPRWIIIPTILIVLGGLLYFLLIAPKQRRFVPTFGKIIYASDRNSPGHTHLWITDVNGHDSKQLLTSEAVDPSFSPDGNQVIYLSSVNGNPQIYLTDADGQNTQQITRNTGAKQRPTFAPSNNNLIAYASGGVISTADVTSGDSLRLLPPAPDPSHTHSGDTLIDSPTVTVDSYAWIPGTDQDTPGMAGVEATSDVQALVLLPSLSERPRDTRTDQPGNLPLAAADSASLGCSPDGSRLAVAMMGIKGLPPGQNLSAIVLFDRQSNALHQSPLAMTNSAALGPQHPAFSPDGAQIIFELWQQPDLTRAKCLGLFTVPADGGTPPRQIVKGDAEHAQFTHDGQSLLFLRRRPDGGRDLYTISREGAGLTRISNGTEDITGFALSPQSRTKS